MRFRRGIGVDLIFKRVLKYLEYIALFPDRSYIRLLYEHAHVDLVRLDAIGNGPTYSLRLVEHRRGVVCEINSVGQIVGREYSQCLVIDSQREVP